MSAHPPPVPPEQQPKHGGDRDRADVAGPGRSGSGGPPAGNNGEQGDPANVKQNTTHQGGRQDR